MIKKMYSINDIFAIIDIAIKDELNRKNAFIAKNGCKDADAINSFDYYIAALSTLYTKF